MELQVFRDRESLGRAAAERAATALRQAIRARGTARLVAATGVSQFELLDALTQLPGIDWKSVELFHLDEYIGLPMEHKASFRRYLLERLIRKTGITQLHLLDTEGDFREMVRRVSAAIAERQIDLAFVGIGENGHLAFNDPPADFEDERPYIIVNLDEACRCQQVGEGWFDGPSEVPSQAVSMSVRQILKAREIIAVVPDRRKAQAVKACIEGEISPMTPASILRTHGNTTIFLDQDSAELLTTECPVLG